MLSDGAAVVRIATPDVEKAAALLQQLGLQGVQPDPAREELRARLGDAAPEEVARAVVTAGLRLRGLAVERPDLEDLFVALTGEGFDVLQ